MPDWGYLHLQEPYERLGDTFVVVSPGGMVLYTQNAEAIHQITARREHFPKRLADYKILTLYGQNVVTTEAALWRLHRKATSASFNEKNAAHTFAEAVHQTQGMIDKWLAQAREGDKTIRTAQHDTMTLALNIIGYVGFGLRFLWPGQEPPRDVDSRFEKYGGTVPPAGHSMTFPQSLATVLEQIVALLLVPWWLLREQNQPPAPRPCSSWSRCLLAHRLAAI